MRRILLAFALALSTVAVTPQASAAEVVISEDARAHFAAGVNFLQDPDGARYEDAYREFKAAYAASPSWKILGNLGLAAMKLERDGEAAAAYKQYLAEGGNHIDRDEVAQVQRDMKTIEAGLGTFEFSIDPPGASLVDERVPSSGATVVNRYNGLAAQAALGLRAGHHRVTVQLAGYQAAVFEFDLAPRQVVTHVFQLQAQDAAPALPVAPPPTPLVVNPEPTPAPSNPNQGLRTGAYVALGVGAAGIALGTVFGLRARSRYSEANDVCDEYPCQLTQAEADQRQSLADSAGSSRTISLVGFIVGGAGAAAGITLFVLSGKNGQTSGSGWVAPYVAVGSAGLRGSF